MHVTLRARVHELLLASLLANVRVVPMCGYAIPDGCCDRLAAARDCTYRSNAGLAGAVWQHATAQEAIERP